MRSLKSGLRFVGMLGILSIAVPVATAGRVTPTAHAAAIATKLTGSSLGTQTFTNTVMAAPGDMSTGPEVPPSTDADAGGISSNVNRTFGALKGNGRAISPTARAKSNPTQIASFEGLNHYLSRYANHGNQFSLEPPDQALCAGNGYVVEGVNDAIGVYQRNGASGTRLGYSSLNEFFNFTPAINRTTGVYGNEVTDPICYFDPSVQRFYFAALTLNIAPNGVWYGGNELDISVSQTANPLGSWKEFSIPAAGFGLNCPCLADYPHIGADNNGIYISTNNFPLTTNGFNGSWIYALSKQSLLNGEIDGWIYSTQGAVAGDGGWTVWPATAPAGQNETAAGGTEYFLSSTLDNCAACTTSDNRVAVWALTDSKELTNPIVSPPLTNTTVTIQPYTDPPMARQPMGDNPTLSGYYGVNSTFVGPIASNDSRNLSTVFANGKLWGALNTAVNVNGHNEVGIAYYVIVPSISSTGQLSAKLFREGTLGVPDADLVFPSVGVNQSGRGVIAFTLTGPNDFPSAAYASLDAKIGAGAVQIAAPGADSADGFSEYGSRPRFGDYGATALDGNTLWLASEYIASSCNLSTYLATGGKCNGTRSYLANWSTRVTAVNIQP